MIVTITSKTTTQNYVPTNISSNLFSNSYNITLYTNNNTLGIYQDNYDSSFGPINNSTNNGDNDIDYGVFSIIMLVILSFALFGFLVAIIYIIKEECKYFREKKKRINNNTDNQNHVENPNENNDYLNV